MIRIPTGRRQTSWDSIAWRQRVSTHIVRVVCLWIDQSQARFNNSFLFGSGYLATLRLWSDRLSHMICTTCSNCWVCGRKVSCHNFSKSLCCLFIPNSLFWLSVTSNVHHIYIYIYQWSSTAAVCTFSTRKVGIYHRLIRLYLVSGATKNRSGDPSPFISLYCCHF